MDKLEEEFLKYEEAELLTVRKLITIYKTLKAKQ
jgi:hypothetical protein